MRLLLAKVELTNWKCYRHEVIDLHQTEGANIAVIFGNNGFGKTSLLEAIRWCLYGSDAMSKTELASRFNRVAVKENPNVTATIQLTFKRDDETILISRSAVRSVHGLSTQILVEEATYNLDGENRVNPRDRIDQLLPGACKEFYFFDGVEIKRYAQNVHSAEMRGAIERILGIPELRNLRDDAKKTMASIDQELTVVQASQPELRKKTEQLQEKLDEQSILREQITLAQSDHEAAVTIFESLRAEASSQESLRTQLDEVDRKQREIDRLGRDLIDAELLIEQSMRQIPITLLSAYVAEVASEMQRKALNSARRSGISSQLRNILETAMCVCGRELDEASRTYIQVMLSTAPSGDAMRAAMIEEQERNQLEILALHKAPDFGELLAKRDRVEDDLDGLNQELQSLRGQGNLPTVPLADLWRKVGDAEANMKSRREAIESLRRSDEQAEAEINRLRRERENLATRSAETASLGRQAVLARRLYEASKELIDLRIAETRAQIEETTTEIHLAVTNKPTEYIGVEISADDYSLRIRSAAGDLLDPDTLSAGEKEALAFAFIAGLNVASGKSAPFVMDTPFGHLDISHQRNLVTALPKLPSQVTLLATDRDLPEALLKEIEPWISDTLTISRVGATDDASVIRRD